MHSMKKLAVLLILCTPLWGGANEQTITTDRKKIDVIDGGNYVRVQGTWRRISARPTITVPTVNSVRVECDKPRRVCTEYVAKLIQKRDDPLGNLVSKPYLFLSREEFRVLEWSRTIIAARAEPRAADIDLRISLIDLSAERTSRETSARGTMGAKPSDVEQWVLE
jgi:hypothetical protein